MPEARNGSSLTIAHPASDVDLGLGPAFRQPYVRQALQELVNQEGIIERVEPRKTVLSRAIRGRRQIIVTNVDQLLIIASAASSFWPTIKTLLPL